MKKELTEQTRELVNQKIFETVDKSTSTYIRLGKIQDGMSRVEKAGEHMAHYLDTNNWSLVIESRNNTILQVGSTDVLNPQILETVKQLITLLEAIHYSERKAAIIDFNNSLKESNDGKDTSK